VKRAASAAFFSAPIFACHTGERRYPLVPVQCLAQTLALFQRWIPARAKPGLS